MTDQLPKGSHSSAIRFLSFANDKEDAEKEAKLKEAAAKIELAVARQKAMDELVDYKPPSAEDQAVIDPVNDTRPLYERLLEQRNKKKEALEESQKLSNLITKLDEEDVSHLNQIAKARREEELRKRLEILDALEAKKRIDEQKLEEEKTRMKELLLGTSAAPMADGSFKNKSLKSKLASLIKMKPREKPIPSQSSPRREDQQNSSNPVKPMDMIPKKQQPQQQPTAVSTTKRPNQEILSERAKKRPATSVHCDMDDEVPTTTKDDPSIYGVKADNVDCNCPKDVSTIVGVLPSLPIRLNDLKDDSSGKSDTDSDDDELYLRLVPKVRVSHRRKH